MTRTRKPSHVTNVRGQVRIPLGVGFPDTQEVGDINKRAEAMLRKKREEVEREVGVGGGKYRRR